VIIVSGLALGIDGEAHKACLEEEGKTVAVLANGLDTIYPVSHTRLGNAILDRGGALICEYPPGSEPMKHQFLERNRIVAGLSMGTVVVEANEKSGALTTARLASEYGRIVFAVPGDAERMQSAGTNNLIKQGAVPVWKGKDILVELNISQEKIEQKKPKLREDLQNILDLLSQEPIHVDNLAANSGLDISKINVILIELELKGFIRNVGGMQFVKNN
jgi:DNA processing protein